MAKIGPSLMCADMGNLEDAILRLDQKSVDFFHLDVMDGRFVPNFTLGPDIVKTLRSHTKTPFDIHLMIEEPEKYIDVFADSGADMISVHVEATTHLQRTLQLIRNRGLKAGIALNPATPLSNLDYIWDTIDYVVLMTVNPGFAGQKFIPLVYDKIEQLSQYIAEKQLTIDIQVDGNISFETIPKVLEKGADMLVCGTSSLFKKDNFLEEAMDDLNSFISSL
ncbi:ribulose-phosphate 3-epimerase [Lentibacillus amyloliquefaciens]|uniref:Ribulose-phosphate 3-epimerase n=1 Tax=Lentibacillus amyloliquefaciens TaxID=1472767 RepID=A0A0U3WGL5_9BACI|nr:ribulose-phosphate 3-epimerase [Lentibacillus amyloliquefaciens]ALX49007.1 ribulose phosphate epimerase [Lentibacillus amyloliquefaciens]